MVSNGQAQCGLLTGFLWGPNKEPGLESVGLSGHHDLGEEEWVRLWSGAIWA